MTPCFSPAKITQTSLPRRLGNRSRVIPTFNFTRLNSSCRRWDTGKRGAAENHSPRFRVSSFEISGSPPQLETHNTRLDTASRLRFPHVFVRPENAFIRRRGLRRVFDDPRAAREVDDLLPSLRVHISSGGHGV